VSDGVQAWYDLIALFYKLQNLFTYFAVNKQYRENVVRILQGNLYQPEMLQRARDMIAIMDETYERIMANPSNLLRPWALAPKDNNMECANANGAPGCAEAKPPAGGAVAIPGNGSKPGEHAATLSQKLHTRPG